MIKNRIEHLLKHNTFIQTVYRIVMSFAFRCLGIFIPVDDKLILMNGHGYKYNDSPKAIFLKMKELGMLNEYKVVWALKDPNSITIDGAEIIKMDTMKYFITALKAKYWISCVNIERGLHFKKSKTIYLNTWHGASLNFVGNAVNGRNDFHFEHIDYFCYNGEYEHEFIKRDFNVREEALIPTGYPRNDDLYEATAQTRDDLKEKLHIAKNMKVILYAPTWRESNDGGDTYKLIPPIDWKKWERILGKEYVLLLRTHPYTTQLLNVEFNDFVRNYTDYPDVNDLLIVSDVLISDYSCIQLDYSILCKPQFCFGYDYDEYIKTRGFYFNLEKDMPNGVIKNEDILLKAIVNMDYDNECEKSRRFKETHMEYGGHAAEKCISIVFGKSLKRGNDDKSINGFRH